MWRVWTAVFPLSLLFFGCFVEFIEAQIFSTFDHFMSESIPEVVECRWRASESDYLDVTICGRGGTFYDRASKPAGAL